MKKILLAGASALMLSTPAAVMADEGMWLPSQTGAIADAMKQAGLELDPATLGDLQRPPLTAIASLGGWMLFGQRLKASAWAGMALLVFGLSILHAS